MHSKVYFKYSFRFIFTWTASFNYFYTVDGDIASKWITYYTLEYYLQKKKKKKTTKTVSNCKNGKFPVNSDEL